MSLSRRDFVRTLGIGGAGVLSADVIVGRGFEHAMAMGLQDRRAPRGAMDHGKAATPLFHGRCAWIAMRAGVALGSNLGERLAHLRNARKEISAMSGALPPLRCSAIYETEPVNCEEGAAKFFNAVIEFGYAGPPEERPPLIVMSHGGPTSSASTSLRLSHQFWTSRGFAVVDVNYGGSSGYGRAYRQRLEG